MTSSRKILNYATRGLHSEIKHKEKELKRINGAVYRIHNNLEIKGRYNTYTLSKLQELRNEFKHNLKELKKEYNQLVVDVDRKHLKVIYNSDI